MDKVSGYNFRQLTSVRIPDGSREYWRSQSSLTGLEKPLSENRRHSHAESMFFQKNLKNPKARLRRQRDVEVSTLPPPPPSDPRGGVVGVFFCLCGLLVGQILRICSLSSRFFGRCFFIVLCVVFFPFFVVLWAAPGTPPDP